MIWYIIITLILLLSTWIYLSCSRHYRLHTFAGTRIIPGDQPDWVLGNIRTLGLLRGIPIHRGFLAYQHKFGDYWQYFLGNCHQLVLCKPEHAQHILSQRAIYDLAASTQEKFSLMVPQGMICLTGETHRRHARVILPMLKKARGLPFVPSMSDATDLLLSQWERAYKQPQTEGKDPDISKGLKNTHILKHMQALTLDLIGEIAYGESCDAIPHVYHDFISTKTTSQAKPETITTLAQATSFLVERFVSITRSGLPPWIVYYVLKFDKPWQQSRNVILAYIEKHVALSGDVEVTSASEQVNLLQRLVGVLSRDDQSISNDGNTLNRDEVFDELLTIILAGYETSSTVLSWFIVFLSKNPSVQQRIKDEIRKVIPKESGMPAPLSQSQLEALEYMDAVVKETLRLAPTAQGVGRMAIQDDVIDGIQIKAGQEVTIPSINLHVDPRNWTVDPWKYDPDRFFGENAPDKNHHPYAFLPFGGGAHGCAGQELAKVELKAIMTRLMQRVTFHDTPENKATEVLRITCVPMDVCVRVTWD